MSEELVTETVEENVDASEVEKKVVETTETDSVVEKEDVITMTTKEYQAKIDSLTDKKVNSVAKNKNDEIARLKEQLSVYEKLSSDEVKAKLIQENKESLEKETKELTDSLNIREQALIDKEKEFDLLVSKHNKLVSEQSTQQILEKSGLPISLSSELVDKYGTDLEKINERILELKDAFDTKNREIMNKKVALNNPKIQKNIQEESPKNTFDLIKSLRNKNKK